MKNVIIYSQNEKRHIECRGDVMKTKKTFRLKYIIIFVVAILVLYGLFCSYVVMMRTVRTVAQSQMEQVASEAIHYAISASASKGDEYGDIVDICRDEEGSIESLTLNSHTVNKIKSDISLSILEYLSDSENYIVKVPVGNFFSSEFVWGMGPKIKFKIVPLNATEIDFESKFVPAGINQVLHTVNVKVNVRIMALLPGFEEISEVTSSAVISESVIIGDVPQTYFDF